MPSANDNVTDLPFDLPIVAGTGRETGEIFSNGEVTAFCVVDPHREMEDEDANRAAKEIVRRVNAHDDLLTAARTVLADLHARIDAAPDDAKPVFRGMAALAQAIAKAEVA